MWMQNHQHYRVFDDQSFIKFDERTGFTAGTLVDPFEDTQSTKIHVERHANWGNRIPTPFISTTTSRENALHLAEKRAHRGHLNIRIAIINGLAVGSVHPVSVLITTTGAEIDGIARNRSEHLCVHHIPREAITKVCTLSEFINYCSEQGDLYLPYVFGHH